MKKKPQKSRALEYAALGLRVHPLHSIVDGQCSCDAGSACTHPGKHPRTPNGVKDATIDRKTIKAWWDRWPNANIGIATGRVSDIFVLDVDGDVGKASLKELTAKHGRLPKTVTVRTGRGRHRYFRCDGARVGNSVGKVGKGIDVRGEGGYIVAAGSVHVSGANYHFADGRGLEEIKVASAPDWLLDFVRKDYPPAPRPRTLSIVSFRRPNLIVLVRTRSRPVIVSSNASQRRPSTSGMTR